MKIQKVVINSYYGTRIQLSKDLFEGTHVRVSAHPNAYLLDKWASKCVCKWVSGY